MLEIPTLGIFLMLVRAILLLGVIAAAVLMFRRVLEGRRGLLQGRFRWEDYAPLGWAAAVVAGIGGGVVGLYAGAALSILLVPPVEGVGIFVVIGSGLGLLAGLVLAFGLAAHGFVFSVRRRIGR